MRFAKGDRVQFTERLLRQFPQWRGKGATVATTPRGKTTVAVRVDGYRSVNRYAASFVRHAEPSGAPTP